MLQRIVYGATSSLVVLAVWGCSGKPTATPTPTGTDTTTSTATDTSANTASSTDTTTWPDYPDEPAPPVTTTPTSDPPTTSKSIDPGLYENGVDGSPLLKLIESANSSLDIEIYEMTDLAVKAAVLAALDRGVAVRIVAEPHLVGSKCGAFSASTSDCSAETQYIADFKAKGGQYAPFNKTMCGYDLKCVEHGKLVVVDGTRAMVSTGNYAPSSLCDAAEAPSTCNVDYSYVLTDPSAVAALDEIISKDLAGTTYDVASVASPVSSRITVSPVTSDDLLQMIEGAQTSIALENQYLHWDTLNAALKAAAVRGVEVTVLVEGLCAFGSATATDRTNYETVMGDLASAGATSLAYTASQKVGGSDGYLHAKTIVVDGNRAWVGSVNGSRAAFEDNREFGAYLTDPAEVQKLADAQKAHMKGAETWQTNAKCTNKYN